MRWNKIMVVTDPDESCPECGDEMVFRKVRTDGLIGDGDEVYCCRCGYETSLSVDENGSHWLQWL